MIKTKIHTIDAIVDNLGRQICGFNLFTWKIYWKEQPVNIKMFNISPAEKAFRASQYKVHIKH